MLSRIAVATDPRRYGTTALSSTMGVHLVGSVGGGDMPCCITVLFLGEEKQGQVEKHGLFAQTLGAFSCSDAQWFDVMIFLGLLWFNGPLAPQN